MAELAHADARTVGDREPPPLVIAGLLVVVVAITVTVGRRMRVPVG